MESAGEHVVRDLGSRREFSDHDIDHTAANHRQQNYIGLRLPRGKPKRPGRSSRKRQAGRTEPTPIGDSRPPASMTPSEQIQNLLHDVDDEEKPVKDVFCQMDVLYRVLLEYKWREKARWVKYEEDVEEEGERWSKPHVASLSLHSLFELRSCLTMGAVMLEMDAHHITQVADLLLDHLVNSKLLEESMRDAVRAAMAAPHAFQHTKVGRRMSSTPDEPPKFRRMSLKNSFSSFSRTNTRRDTLSSPNLEGMMNGGLPESASSAKLNQQFMKKIPDGAEAANIMVGELDGLKYQVVGFVRLTEARNIGDITEVPLPTRFIFFLLGPLGSAQKNFEIGRSMSTLMVDEVFRAVAYKARTRVEILAGLDEFLDQVTALPPGEWDPKIRIEPPQSVPSQEQRILPKIEKAEEEEEEEESHCDPTLQRSGRLFGGLINDVKRKIPWYASDFKDCLHIQCIASVIFLYLATLTPNVTFGGLLGLATDKYMGTMECILTASIVGVLFALFAGQPLNILGSTGPMLVLEMILYHFCHDNDLDFLPFRAWIGLWTTLILLLIVAFDLSALVRYITRFTEESFACLIAVIFIAEAFKKLFGILDKAPINTHPEIPLVYDCWCLPPNNATDNGTDVVLSNMTSAASYMVTSTASYVMTSVSDVFDNMTSNFTMNNTFDWAGLTHDQCLDYGGNLTGPGCDTPHYKADIFLLSVILFLGTFCVATGLTSFKTSSFFPTFVRQTLSDFAVLIAIVSMVLADSLIGLHTPKLEVPVEFKPTKPGRPWVINPISDKNPWWLILAAIIPALLATILIFMDQQITAVIVNRKENKLKKGSGYHLDMFVVAICIAICSLLGLPWYVAATVSALAHIMSLKKESECTAPGEKPSFLGVREQRVTALLVGLLSGASVLFTKVLRIIPMPVLYGVFLYMGVAALKGMQFIDRIMLFFKPAKYQPDYMYLRYVPIKRVHIFTVIQIICLAGLWVIKSFKQVSIIFPLMVLGMCFVRKAMDYIFSQRELKWLDDLMPEDKQRAKDDAKKKMMEDDDEREPETESLLEEGYRDRLSDVKHHHSRLDNKYGPAATRRSSVDTDRVNITEEMAKTGIWMKLRQDSSTLISEEDGAGNRRRKRDKSHRDKNGSATNEANSGNGQLNKPAFYIQEDQDEEAGEDKANQRCADTKL